MVVPTSLFAYEDAKQNLGDKQQKVLEAIISLGKCCDKKIAAFLGWEINRVTPRRKELADLGKIEMDGIERNEQNRPVQVWKFKV